MPRFGILFALQATLGLPQTPEVHRAKPVEVYQAKPIEVYRAKPIEVQPARPMDGARGREPGSKGDRSTRPAPKPAREDLEPLFGAWQTVVPGAVWTSPSHVPGWDALHISVGALDGLLVIHPDGTYLWNAYGGKKGRWITPGIRGYTLALEDLAEHRMWNVCLDPRHPGKILIWDGNAFSYEGKRVPPAERHAGR